MRSHSCLESCLAAERRVALERLLARPDPADLGRRAHRVTQPGAADRFERRLPTLLLRWL